MKYLFINKDSIKRALNSTWFAPNWEDDGKEEGGNNKSRSNSDGDILSDLENQNRPHQLWYKFVHQVWILKIYCCQSIVN